MMMIQREFQGMKTFKNRKNFGNKIASVILIKEKLLT